MLGPFQGKLDNAGETIELWRPGNAAPEGAEGDLAVPYVLVERVQYSDNSPWPVRADGQGASLHRVHPNLYSDDPSQWVAALPSPGTVDGDRDGLPDTWERLYGLSPSDAADALLDPDLDGLSTLSAFVCGTKPNDRADFLACALSVLDGRLKLLFRGVAGRAYWVESSPGLNTAGWSAIYHVPSLATDDTVIIDIGEAGSTRFTASAWSKPHTSVRQP